MVMKWVKKVSHSKDRIVILSIFMGMKFLKALKNSMIVFISKNSESLELEKD